MTSLDIASLRLHNQHVSAPAHAAPGEMVHWLVAVQAQDYAGAKWALGLRLLGATDATIEEAFNAGEILRTHLLRPTWHFVTPGDIRWLLALTAPRVLAANASRLRQLDLDAATLARSNDLLAGALQGGRQFTRDELRAVLEAAGIDTTAGNRMAYLLMQAELEGILCSGPRRGKQFTYALLEERVPQAAPLSRDDALAQLARRFFFSHGPATVQDLAKWSGLTVADAQSGLDAVADELQQEPVDGHSTWYAPGALPPAPETSTAYLLSLYDEYFIGYKDRSAIVSDEHAAKLSGRGSALSYIVVVDGQIVGTWRRVLHRDAVLVETDLFVELSDVQHQAVAVAAQHYGDFLGLPVSLT